MTKCSQLSLFVKVQFSSVTQSCPTELNYDWLRGGHATKYWPVRHEGGLLGTSCWGTSGKSCVTAWVDVGHLTMEPSYNGHLTVEQEDGKNMGPQ